MALDARVVLVVVAVRCVGDFTPAEVAVAETEVGVEVVAVVVVVVCHVCLLAVPAVYDHVVVGVEVARAIVVVHTLL